MYAATMRLSTCCAMLSTPILATVTPPKVVHEQHLLHANTLFADHTHTDTHTIRSQQLCVSQHRNHQLVLTVELVQSGAEV